MGKRSAEVDRYIAKAAPFAQPILEKIREAYHSAHSEIEETIKWSMPHFDYKGPLGNMAAFKEHVRFGFWKAKLMNLPEGLGERVTKTSELPSKKELVATIREAVRLNEERVKVERPAPKRSAAPVEVPDDLAVALRKNRKARETFDAFAPSHRREYVNWITEAKQEATRQKRLAQTIEWLAEGKPRNWKYMK
jgi:uncharacterized protein YdeI (YjbR/CyaY-like superfamily)